MKKRHTLTLVGITSVQTAYLDVSEEEAVRRYLQANPEWGGPNGHPVKTFEFNDAFGCYDAWDQSEEDGPYTALQQLSDA